MFPGGFGDAGLYRALGEVARIEARDKAISEINNTYKDLSCSGNYLRNQNERENCQAVLKYTRGVAQKSIQQAYESGHSAKEIAKEALEGTAFIGEGFGRHCIPAQLRQAQPAKTNETTGKISKIGLPKVTKAPSPFDKKSKQPEG